ncbi:hypothetical protein OOT00_15535 [Desulfobotulus sp. H1]|uniref:Uncharacterized protein n=1 Tax=Desulfobotulus pelophilus TaxID=2823377 RepID=A0ABT3ND49_9BACT|nr:hypothetical protein [Desulfobotulus pelophilus]MCW7755393.1 hypothetical protein [Desulfobotulus pelophilus]
MRKFRARTACKESVTADASTGGDAIRKSEKTAMKHPNSLELEKCRFDYPYEGKPRITHRPQNPFMAENLLEINDTRIVTATGTPMGEKIQFSLQFSGIVATIVVITGLFTQNASFVLSLLLPLGLFTALSIACHRLTGKSRIILNRADGSITMPMGFPPRNQSVPFGEIQPFFPHTGALPNPVLRRKEIHLGLKKKPRWSGPAILSYGNQEPAKFREVWSWIVWYMDSNRPLPPGPCFDSYRERDARRLRELGHPPPQYEMNLYMRIIAQSYLSAALNSDISSTPIPDELENMELNDLIQYE